MPRLSKKKQKLEGLKVSSARLGLTRRSSKLLLALVVIGIAALGTYLLIGSHAATANTYYIATNGSDSNACSQAAPCVTFNHAYSIASPGDTVMVASGTYPAQTINWDSTKTNATSNVIFQPASGANVYFSGSVTVLSSHVTIENMVMGDPTASGNAGQSDPQLWHNKFDVNAYAYPLGTTPSSINNVGSITFQGITARNFEIIGAHDVSMLGGSYGPSSACGSGQSSLTQYGGGNNAIRDAYPTYPSSGPHADPYNITIDGATIHNIMSYDLNGCHTEGVAIFSGSGGMKVLNSKFYGNDVYDILAQANSGSGALGSITLQNNWFAASTNSAGTGSGSWGVEMDSIASNVTIDNNSFNYPFLFQDLAGSPSNINIIGNIMPGPVTYSTSSGTVGSACGKSGVTALYNITQSASGQSCTSSTNVSLSSVSSLYTNPSTDSSLNFGLKSGSQAINFVPISAYPTGTAPTNDISYTCRATTGNIDAGASELGATGSCGNPITGGGGSGGSGGSSDTTPPTVSVTAPTNGATVSGSNVSVTANASDDVGVASVQFQLDGANLGSLDTTSPYTTTWDTTGVSNGAHTLKAIAKDAAGNTTTSSSVSVTVNNTVAGCTTVVTTPRALTSAVNSAAGGATICVDGSQGPYTTDGTSLTNAYQQQIDMQWTGGSSRNSKVIVKPLNATPVVFSGSLAISGAQIEVQNISMAGQLYEIDGPAHDIQMTNVTAGHFIIAASGTSVAQNITIKGGSIGPWHSYPDNWIVSGGGNSPNKNITIDGTTIHDMTISPAQLASGTHFECLQVWAADGLTVQNSTFKNCSVFDIFIQAAGSGQPPAPTNVLIQNNFLDCCSYSDGSRSPNYAIQLPTDHGEGTWSNVTIRNNSGDSGIIVGSGSAATFTGDTIENNILPKLDFNLPGTTPPPGLKIDYNEWYSGSKVGTHDLTGASTSSLFGTNFATQDFHLASGAPVIGKADPTAGSYPSTDIDGNPRPASNGPDIGAHEPPGTAPPSCTTGTLAAPTGVTQNGTPTYTTLGLKWTAPSPTAGCTITGYKVFRNGSQIGTTTSTSYNDTGLASGTSYNYSVEATDSGPNTSAQSSIASLSTAADNVAPNIPGGVTATNANPVVVSWAGVTDLPSAGAVGVAGYNVYRCTGAGCSPNVAGTPLNNNTPLTTTSFTDTTVAASTAYRYVITSVDNNNNESAPSSVVTATTPGPTCSGNPSAPGKPASSSSTDTTVALTWSGSTPSAGCTMAGYHIYRADVSSTQPIATVSGTTYSDSNLTPNTSYTYTIEAYDTSSHTTKGTSAAISTALDTSAPSAPPSVVAAAVSSSQVTVSWSASTDDIGVTGYNIYRSDNPTKLLASVSGTTLSYPDTTVGASKTYTYQVLAVDGAGNPSAKTSSNSVTTPAASGTAPAAPTSVAAGAVAAQSAALSWSAPSGGGTPTGYHVYLREGQNGSTTDVFDGDTTTTSFTDSCLEPGVTYTYEVYAYNSAGVSTSAGSTQLTTPSGVKGDVNCSHRVDIADVGILYGHWHQTVLPMYGDVNNSGRVDITDLGILFGNYKAAAP